MNKYNVLIIGAGGQGSEADQPGSGNEHKIISFAHAFKEHDGFETITFYDKNKLKSKKASEIWDCYYSECDINYICEYGDIDVAIITTPDNTHYEILKQLAEYPLKLVICEKPICEDLEQAREIVELYKQKNIPLMINYTRRFLPYYDCLKRDTKPIDGLCIFNRGWLHTATHAIDFFNMIGLENYKIIESTITDKRVWELYVEFEDPIGMRIGWIETRVGDMPVWNYYDKSHWYIVENAYNFLEGKEELKCTGEQALHALEICFKLMKKE